MRGAEGDAGGDRRGRRAQRAGPSRESGQRHHAADRRRDSRDARARPRSTASRCACSSGRARTGTPACRRHRRAAACSARRCAAPISSRYGIDDVLHGASLGLRSILVADLGQLQVLGEMKKRGDLPADFVLKISVTLAAANPATARLLEDLGATSINLPVDLSLPQIAAIRQAIDAAIDFYVESAGRLRRHRAALRNRGARARRRADLPEVRPAQFARAVSERPAHRGDGASRSRASACAAPRSVWPFWRGSMPDAMAVADAAARRMKITAARTTVVGTPWRELVFLELETDTGLVGTSEVRMVSRTDTLVACLDELAPRHVIGTDPFDVERLAWNIQRGGVRPARRSVAVGAGLLRRRLLGSDGPVARRADLEAARRQVSRARARVRERLVSDRARAGRRSPRSHRQVVARGYRALKLDPFGHASAELDARRAPTRRRDRRRRARGRRARRADHGRDARPLHAVDRGRRREAARAVRPGVDRGADAAGEPRRRIASVRAATHLPIATGERAHTMEDIRGFIEGGLVDVVQVDLTHFGGFLPMKRLAGWADAYAPAHGAAQRLRSSRHDGEPALRGGDAELQGARALQRLRRRVGARARRSLAARSIRRDGCFAAPAASGPRADAQSRRVRASIRARAAASSCSRRAGNSGRTSVVTER